VTQQIGCTCLLFEFRGILCQHNFLVLAQKEVKSVSPKYLLKRWIKRIRRRHTYIRASYKHNKDDPHVERYDFMCKRFYEIAEVACQSENGTNLVLTQLDSIYATLDLPILNIVSVPTHKGKEKLTQHPTPTMDNMVRSPSHVKRKGRPRTNKLQSTVKKISKKRKWRATLNKSTRNLDVSNSSTL